MKHLLSFLTGLAFAAFTGASALAQPADESSPPRAPKPPQVAAKPAAADFALAADGPWYVGTGGPATAGRTLVVPKDKPEPKQLAETEEDLNVMSRILEKAAAGRDDKSRRAMGIAVHGGFFGSGSAPRNLYLEGYGALFFLSVNYPLVAPAARSTEAESKEETSSEWDEARRELYQSSGGGGGGGGGFTFNLPEMSGFGGGPAEAYDADRVEDLKKDLIAALKNAAHIRSLKPDENITVIVAGRNQAAANKTVTRRGTAGRSVVVAKSSGQEGAAPRLIVRARKADVEAFQQEKLSLEDFRNKVSVILF